MIMPCLKCVINHITSWSLFSLNDLDAPHYVFSERPLPVTLIQ